MSTISSPRSSSSWTSPTVSGSSLVLKIARDATTNVPIVGQILGVAVHITDLAQQVQKNKETMRALARKASILAQRVDEVVAGRTPSANLLERLVYLKGAFTKVEEFMADEVGKRNPAKNLFRSLFILPAKLEELSQELDSEVAAFSLAAAIDMRLCIEESALYDGQLRRLRDCDIRKLDVIMECETERSIVTYAKARVDGVSDLMVVKYVKSRTEKDDDRKWFDTTSEDILTITSAFDFSHPNIPQIYGRAFGNGATRFSVLRSGVYPASQYLLNGWNDPVKRYAAAHRIHQFVLDASAHLERLGLAWLPTSYDSILVDDRGEPSIGAFDDIIALEGGDPRYKLQAENVINALSEVHHITVTFPARLAYAQSGDVKSCDDGRLKMWIDAMKPQPIMLERIWARLQDENLVAEIFIREEPLYWDCGYIPPAVISQATKHWDDLDARKCPPINQQLERAHEDSLGDDSSLEAGESTLFIDPSNGGDRILSSEVAVEYRIIRRRLLFRGSTTVTVHYGLQFGIYYCTETANVRHWHIYFIHLTEAIASDIFSILGLPSKPAGDFDPECSFTFFSRTFRNGAGL